MPFFEKPINPSFFTISAILFSCIMTHIIVELTKKYRKALNNELPFYTIVLFFMSYILNILSFMKTQYWLMCIAGILIFVMIINASCRLKITTNRELQKGDIKRLILSVFICFITAIILIILITCFLKPNKAIDYIATAPLLLVPHFISLTTMPPFCS